MVAGIGTASPMPKTTMNTEQTHYSNEFSTWQERKSLMNSLKRGEFQQVPNLSLFQQFGMVLGGKCLRLCKKRGHLLLIQFGRSGGTGRDGHAYFLKEFLLSRWGAGADQTSGVCSCVAELVGSIGRYVDGLACVDNGFLAAECSFDLSIQDDERFLKVVAMRAGASARRDVHVNHAETAFRVVSIDGDGIGIADETDVGVFPVMVRIGKGQVAIEIVGRNRRVL